MLTFTLDGYDMPYIELGRGPPLVLVHGSMSDFRVWSPVLGPLSQRFRVIAPSLRYFFPGRWVEGATDFKIARHVADIAALVEYVSLQHRTKVHLCGHSRGGHIAFRVAGQRPDLLASLILAEPGGDLDASLQPSGEPTLAPLHQTFATVAARIRDGDIDGGLEYFVDAIDGAGIWGRLPPATKQELRDNASTLLGQIDEQRQPYSRAAAEAIAVPTLLVAGGKTKPASARNVRVLAAHIPGARTATIPNATHMMFGQAPAAFASAVIAFTDSLDG